MSAYSPSVEAGEKVASTTGCNELRSARVDTFSAYNSRLRRGDLFPPLSQELVHLLCRLGRPVEQGSIEAQARDQAKVALKEVLNIPLDIPIFVFTDERGNAWNKLGGGDVVLDGYLSLGGELWTTTHIGFRFNATNRSLHIDGELLLRRQVPTFLGELEEALAGVQPLSTVLQRTDARAQTTFFFGEVVADEEGGEPGRDGEVVLVTQNFLAPHDFHLFVGTVTGVEPVSIRLGRSPRGNFGTFLRGATQSSREVFLFIPFKGSERAHLSPSLNGKRVRRARASAKRDASARRAMGV